MQQARNALREFSKRVSSLDAREILIALLLLLWVQMLQACSATLPATPTLPPLPSEIKRQPLPFPEFPSRKPS